MRNDSLNKLEYNRVVETVLSYTSTYMGRRLAERLRPSTEPSVIAGRLSETEETRQLIAKGMHVPLPSMEGMEELLALLGTGYVLSETQFGQLATFVRSCGQLQRFMAGKRDAAPVAAAYAASMHDLAGLLRDIEASVDRGRILDGASPELSRIRRRLRVAEDKLQRRLESLLSRYADLLQERLVSQRGGRYVLPVKKEHRRRVPGSVLDESSSGQTVFVEPAETGALQMDLAALQAEEQREELQILANLTGEAERYQHELSINAETVGHYDFLLAKAKWALALDARPASLSADGTFALKAARHPFLAGRPVPLDVAVDGSYRSLLITGPNTGGKTVALKTVGLLTLMAQSGLLIPAAAGSTVAVYRAVEADIGDGQSLDRSLSTFSSHIRNVIDILSAADAETLVLLDELATGTDPGEGVGLSIAVLEELHRRGAVVLATTHFNEIKAYAGATPGFRNARMAFDEDSLQPLYRLDMGEAGDSYAFVIARKLGIDETIVERARVIADGLRAGRAGATAPVIPPAPPRENVAAKPRLAPPAPKRGTGTARPEEALQVGDVVWIPAMNRPAVVYKTPDERGNLVVHSRGEKLTLNRKRVRRYIESKHLYPDDYDMDIVFETIENRKKRKIMSKRHVEGLAIEKPGED
ncbi:DNA mismatch repair protein MutS [Cohnella sp. REN36]|uniref:endonuclease MutS2 n=1 Tax=Cohnella sp. REN36 TaxID=2887347 RepID=UPI001D14F61B|nr:DNA mismatch repair protein MutS [Cohnella sp. REN36]MCC3375676.1 DNA mismatch repair protein MutS [Cohnella sp. REN36]